MKSALRPMSPRTRSRRPRAACAFLQAPQQARRGEHDDIVAARPSTPRVDGCRCEDGIRRAEQPDQPRRRPQPRESQHVFRASASHSPSTLEATAARSSPPRDGVRPRRRGEGEDTIRPMIVCSTALARPRPPRGVAPRCRPRGVGEQEQGPATSAPSAGTARRRMSRSTSRRRRWCSFAFEPGAATDDVVIGKRMLHSNRSDTLVHRSAFGPRAVRRRAARSWEGIDRRRSERREGHHDENRSTIPYLAQTSARRCRSSAARHVAVHGHRRSAEDHPRRPAAGLPRRANGDEQHRAPRRASPCGTVRRGPRATSGS